MLDKNIEMAYFEILTKHLLFHASQICAETIIHKYIDFRIHHKSFEWSDYKFCDVLSVIQTTVTLPLRCTSCISKFPLFNHFLKTKLHHIVSIYSDLHHKEPEAGQQSFHDWLYNILVMKGTHPEYMALVVTEK